MKLYTFTWSQISQTVPTEMIMGTLELLGYSDALPLIHTMVRMMADKPNVTIRAEVGSSVYIVEIPEGS